jgi:(S)-ureidoglycine aminohydrolase
MPQLFGHTRAHVGKRHALITPGNHVNSSLPGVAGATAVVLVSPAMGARVAQTLLTFQTGGSARFAAGETQTFGYVMDGGATVSVGPKGRRLKAGGFFFCPAGSACALSAPKKGTRVTLFQKTYASLPGVRVPKAILGDQSRVKGTPFLGDPAANLQVLLPDEPSFDMAVNLFSYQPGGHLPFVELHVMETGSSCCRVRACTASRTPGIPSARAMPSGWVPTAPSGLSPWERFPRATSITRT